MKRIKESGHDGESLRDSLKALDKLVQVRATVLPLADVDAENLRGLSSHTATQLAAKLSDSCLQRRIRMTCPSCQTGYMTLFKILWYDCIILVRVCSDTMHGIQMTGITNLQIKLDKIEVRIHILAFHCQLVMSVATFHRALVSDSLAHSTVD